MSSETFLDEKKLKKLDREIQQMITRTGVDRKTQDEVFDKATLHALEKLISDRVIDILDFPISTGKEGNVFRGVTPDKKFVAVKIYRVNTLTFKHISEYIVGDPRFKSFHKNRMDIVYIWTKKEFKNLERLKRIKVNAPKPITYYKNVLVMEYLGDSKTPAPMLKDVEIKNPEEIFEKIIDFISLMYKKAELVHSDISAFNILYFKKKPYLIDLGQGVLLEHPNALEFLKRDLTNIVKFFKKYNILADADKIYKEIINKKQ
jgi:RIO kinase 1